MRRFRTGSAAAEAEAATIARLVREALDAHHGQIKPAARHVGVTVQTFKRWMARLGLREPSPTMVRRGWR